MVFCNISPKIPIVWSEKARAAKVDDTRTLGLCFNPCNCDLDF